MSYTLLTEEEVRRANAESGRTLNVTEANVLGVACWLEENGETSSMDRVKELTGYTEGQVRHALVVLRAVGMVEA